MVVIPSKHRHSTEEQGNSGSEQGGEDGASYRGIAAAYSAAGKPDRGEAEDVSSSARHMGRPFSDPRGGNAADESQYADGCPDGNDTFWGRVRD